MLISAVVPTYDRYASLGNCLAHLAAQTLPREQHEIIVVDNTPDRAESDRQARVFAELPNLRWIHEPRPGAANARNVGMWQARAPLIAFIDDDVLAAPDWLAALVAAAAQFGEAVHLIAGPVHADWGAPRPAWLAEGMLGYLSLLDHGAPARELLNDELVTSANLTYRTEQLRAAGGFATALGRAGSGSILLSNEETELTERIKAAGGRVGWAPDAVVAHRIDPARLQPRWFRRRAAWQAVSDFIQHPDYFSRHFARNWAEANSYFRYQDAPEALALLARDHSEPDKMHWEASAIYHLMLCLLGGAALPDVPG